MLKKYYRKDKKLRMRRCYQKKAHKLDLQGCKFVYSESELCKGDFQDNAYSVDVLTEASKSFEQSSFSEYHNIINAEKTFFSPGFANAFCRSIYFNIYTPIFITHFLYHSRCFPILLVQTTEFRRYCLFNPLCPASTNNTWMRSIHQFSSELSNDDNNYYDLCIITLNLLLLQFLNHIPYDNLIGAALLHQLFPEKKVKI